MGPKFSDSSDETLRKSCTASSLKKPQEVPFSPLLCAWEVALSLRINLNHMFLLEQSLFECTIYLVFPKKLLNYCSSCAPSNHKTSEALSTTEDWMELITSSSASPGPTVLPSHISRTPHTWTLLLPFIQTHHKTTPHRSSASSLDKWKLLKLL